MASLEEVWGSSFPKKHYSMVSKTGMAQKEEPRDAEREGRIAPTPVHRSTAAVQRHRKTIDDLTKTLPIVHNDDEADSNYAPARVGNTEHFTATKGGYSKPFFPSDSGTSFAYAPPSFQGAAHELKLDRIMRMIEQNKTGYETPSSHDMALYVFTGVMTLFVLDTFVNLGRRMG
jgi:hypothetical protein